MVWRLAPDLTRGVLMRWWERWAVVQTVVVALGGVIYRHTLYGQLPVAPGDAYGIGDVLDFGFWLLVVASAGACLLFAACRAIVPPWRRLGCAATLSAVALGSVVGFYLGHW